MAGIVQSSDGSIGFDQGYAMAGVLGQYFFYFKIDGVGDFLGESGQIHSFMMEEKMGGDVPIFELTFSTTNPDVLTSINEGSIIECLFGRDMFDYSESLMVIQRFDHHVENADYWIVTLGGLLSYTSEYLGNDGQASYPLSSSKDAIIAEASPYFLISDETSGVNFDDIQTWLRLGVPPIMFINETWKHSFITEDNFLMYAIDFAGVFILMDLKTLISQPVKWILSHEYPAPANMAAYTPDINVGSEFGLMNHLAIYQKAGHYHNGATEETVVEATPSLDTTLIDGPLNIISDSPTTWELPKIFDEDNVHDNFNVSRYITTTRNVLQNSVELNIILENKWQDYQLFDLIEFVPYIPDDGSSFLMDTEAVAGIYAITRISRFFGQNRAGIEITISRDGMNNMDGDFDVYTSISSLIGSIF